MKRRTLGGLVLAFICMATAVPSAVAEESDPAAIDTAWARIDAAIDADIAAGKSFADKAGPAQPEPASGRTTGVAAPASSGSSGGGGGAGTGTTVGNIGTYPTRRGVILVTPDYLGGVVPTGHAGIVYSGEWAVESILSGVQLLPNKWYQNKSQAYGVVVRATSWAQDDAAASWAYAQRGKPYNYAFTNVNRRDKFYCAQLVWAAFKDKFGIDLNRSDVFGAAIHPLEFVNNSKTKIIYRMRP